MKNFWTILLVALALVLAVGVFASFAVKPDNDIDTDKPGVSDDVDKPEEDNGPYTVTLSADFLYLDEIRVGLDGKEYGPGDEECVELGSSFECKEFYVLGNSAGGEVFLYKTASGKLGWFEHETQVKLTEDITILCAVDGDVVREGGLF